MNARSDRQVTAAMQTPTRAVPSSSSVVNIVVRVAGMVPVRLDLTHAGAAEQQLGLTLGTVLVYQNPQELHQTGENPQVA